jgi:hypothetical protein
VWLASGSQVLELDDTGQSLARDLSAVFTAWDMNWESAAGPGVLYGGAGLKLFRIATGSNEVICRDRSPEDLAYPNRLDVGGDYLWSAAGNNLVAFDESLMEVRRLATGTNSTIFAASGDAVYYFGMTNRTPTLMRGDAVAGEQTRLESWDMYAKQWCMRTYNTDKPSSGLWTPGSPYWLTAENSGRLHMLYHRPTSPKPGEFDALGL